MPSSTSNLVSTVPGALQQLYDYAKTVASAVTIPSGQVGAYIGLPTERVQDNYIIIGDDETGEMFTSYDQSWVGLPAGGYRKGEQYQVPVSIRAWSGSANAADRFDRMMEAFTLLNAFMNLIMLDPNGRSNGLINLTASGSWQIKSITNPANGVLGDRVGWGTILRVMVEVRNVRITG